MLEKEKKKVSELLAGIKQSNKKGLAWLIDPDKCHDPEMLAENFSWVKDSELDLIFVGGSSTDKKNFSLVVRTVSQIAGTIPVVIFPGSQLQVSKDADAILFLSLISGRNPDYLIGQQIAAAPKISKLGIEVLPTAYLLVNDGEITSVHAVSQTLPILNSQSNLVKDTALAGHFLGMKYVFLDAGSGAKSQVSPQVIELVKKEVPCPVIVGGGIDSLDKLKKSYEAGADLIVVGNSIEKDPGFLAEVLNYKSLYNLSLNVN
ncbi:geranylgeranylglyceryl/heptaprenylglyceryl phosphate synthase [Algoriphagus lutimaris]|uniref:geranylgeranylglyceryl/heptaprenylglyceryl phosphate synthase n=1 Tax=Algoriphagus lutimaris TaxID=613197 RepID=UPI00196B36DA|nr:geranylgeranylglyceryl/heptaprenylglyceryl phosphate synthase [Algoriphagus lutimaris]MBN3520895.1 geranylgeranylglyceryl/heptaprenylglyceryl phosphate synthase [Algoriphagus lutimaris]